MFVRTQMTTLCRPKLQIFAILLSHSRFFTQCSCCTYICILHYACIFTSVQFLISVQYGATYCTVLSLRGSMCSVERYWHCRDETVHYKLNETVNFCCFRCVATSRKTVFINFVFYIYICCFFCFSVCQNVCNISHNVPGQSTFNLFC